MRNSVMVVALLAACGGGGEVRKQESQCRLARVDGDDDGDGTPGEPEILTYPGVLGERWETVGANGRPNSVTVPSRRHGRTPTTPAGT